MALPHGALEQLLSPDGGVAAFDKAVADSQAQTQALLNREPAPGPTNQVKKDVKPGTAKDAATNEPPKGRARIRADRADHTGPGGHLDRGSARARGHHPARAAEAVRGDVG